MTVRSQDKAEGRIREARTILQPPGALRLPGLRTLE